MCNVGFINKLTLFLHRKGLNLQMIALNLHGDMTVNYNLNYRSNVTALIFLQKMLDYLKDKKDVGFFLSVQALMQTCR